MELKCLCIKSLPDFQEGAVYEYQHRLTGASNLPKDMYVIFSYDADKVFYTDKESFLKNFSLELNPKEDFRSGLKRIKEQIRK